MVEGSSILETDLIFLLQTKDEELKRLLSKSVQTEDCRFEAVEDVSDLNKAQPQGNIITFVIGSDISDPIQSAQRFHAFEKQAKIVLLAKSENDAEDLREAIKFSPFISVEVSCLNETHKEELSQELSEILHSSRKAEEYRAVVQETNARISHSAAPKQPAFTRHFINKLLDIAPIGIAIVTPRGKILGWNKEAAFIFDKNEAQVLGTTLSHLFQGLHKDKLEVYLEQCLQNDQPAQKDPLTVERSYDEDEDTAQFLNITAAPFSYSEGAEKALILAMKDVTERKLAQQELQEVNETLEERIEERTASLLSYQEQLRSLASKLSKAEEKERHQLAAELHDNLGQMLAVNKMKVDLLPTAELPEEMATDIEEIKQGLDDALVYTRNLMSDLKPPPTLDKEDVRATIDWLAQKMEKHGLEVRIKDDGEPKRTSEEIRTTLLQCVRELLFNVIKHAGVKEALIDMTRQNNRLQIDVVDKGTGIDASANVSTSTEHGGFGLFNIQERMDLLGGSMDITSHPGKGTTVTLIAPLKYGDKEADTSENVADKKHSSSGPRRKIEVILVDDHQMVREGLKKIVNNEDDMLVIAEASDGEEAIELAREHSPDIIVMDVNMPHMNGIDATQEILANLSNVRVIGLSLHDHQNVSNSMRDAGATAYLSKNEAFETLGATIRSEAKAIKQDDGK